MRSKSSTYLLILLSIVVVVFLINGFYPKGTVSAAGFFVDPVAGNNATGNGTESSPWRTITFALSQVSSGDTINLKSGIYNTQSGELFPINLKAGVNLVGTGCNNSIVSGDGANDVLFINAANKNVLSNTTISNIQFQDGRYGIAIFASNSKTVSAVFTNICAKYNEYGLHISTGETYENGATINSIFENGKFNSNTFAGIYMEAYGYFSPSSIVPEINNSVVNNNGTYGIFLEAKAVSNNETTTGPIISETKILNNGNHGIYAHGTYSGWLKPILNKVQILDNGGYGFYWEQGINSGNVDAEITNSIIGRNQGGVYINRRDYYTYSQPNEITITNSTIVDNKEFGIYWIRKDTSEVSPYITNSIIWNPDGDDLYSEDYYQGEVAWLTGSVQTSLIRDGDLSGVDGNFNAYPQFAASYHIAPCSPAVDSGGTVGLTEDFENDIRPYNAQFDIGADEVNQPCILQAQLNAESLANWDDILHYTLTITNSSSITGTNITITDILPDESTYVTNSLWSTAGSGSFNAGEINWSGFLAPNASAIIGWEARVIKADLAIRNLATINSDEFGTSWASWETQIPPETLSLPIVMLNYCGMPSIDDFSNPISGWPVADDGSIIYRYLGGEYNIFHRDAGRWAAVTRGDYWQNATGISIEGHTAQNSGVWGVVFGLNENWSNFYTFELVPQNQAWYLLHFTSSSGWSVLSSGTRPFISSGLSTNKIDLESNGNYINFFVNDQLVTTFYSQVPGRIGLTGGSFISNTGIFYDNYVFAAEGCPLTANSFIQGDAVQNINLERPELEELMHSQE